MAATNKRKRGAPDAQKHGPTPQPQARVKKLVRSPYKDAKLGSPVEPSEPSSILFYTDSDKYGEFSNYYILSSPFKWKDREYCTSEHAFQAAKFLHPEANEHSLAFGDEIRKASTPNKARILALQKTGGGYAWRTQLNDVILAYKEKGVVIRPDWVNIRDHIMREILLCKFSQNLHCKKVLMGTGDMHLVEHTKRDSYWGDGGDGSGQNRLGELLMEVRDTIRNTNASG
ncbi:hypothetical protein DFJ77DRAFT_467136 [Powellomyces hirtus]|nr:hypothetical protein DFJ77DRAFT_467136 [Powellomyces hirtus]